MFELFLLNYEIMPGKSCEITKGVFHLILKLGDLNQSM